MKTKDWVNTDPDNFQFCQKVAGKVFRFKEFDLSLFNPSISDTMKYLNDRDNMTTEAFVDKYWDDDELWIEQEIDIEQYTLDEIQDILDSYGYEYDGEFVTFQTGDYYEADALVAECIFEYETQY